MDSQVGTYLLRTTRLPITVGSSRGSNKALVIVETRPSFFLPHVVASAVATHPGWHLYVFGTPLVHALLQSHFKEYENVTRVTLDAGARMTTTQYSHLLMSPGFWSVIKEEHILVFQADCVLVRQTPDRLLGYDFVGAVCGTVKEGEFCMNGGLSLRRRTSSLRAAKLIHSTHPHLLEEPEDIAFCKVMRAHPGMFAMPSMQTCNLFAIESMGDPDRAVGMHGTDKYYASPLLVAALLSRVS